MLLLALLSGLCVVWRLDTERTTDDAFVYADTVSIAPEVSGRITVLDVRENQYVKRGQLLFRIDPKEYLEQLQRSQASLLALNEEIKLNQRTVDAQKFTADSESATVREARAVLEQSTASLNRIVPLYRSGTVSAQALDDARTRQQGAQAALESAVQKAKSARAGISGVEALIAKRAVLEADIALARINLDDTEVRSPVDGLVTGLETTLGHYASTGSHIFSIIDAGRWYVVASFRETELTKIQPGIPYMALSIIMMFSATRENARMTMMSGKMIIIGASCAVLLSLLLMSATLDWTAGRVTGAFPVTATYRFTAMRY